MIRGYRVVLVQQVADHKPKIFYRVDSKFHISGWNSDQGKAIVFDTLTEAFAAIDDEVTAALASQSLRIRQIGVEPVYGFIPPLQTV